MSFSPEYKKQLEREAAERVAKGEAREEVLSGGVANERGSDVGSAGGSRGTGKLELPDGGVDGGGRNDSGDILGVLEFSGSFAEVAAEVGVSERTVRRWASGESRPSPLAMKALKERGWM